MRAVRSHVGRALAKTALAPSVAKEASSAPAALAAASPSLFTPSASAVPHLAAASRAIRADFAAATAAAGISKAPFSSSASNELSSVSLPDLPYEYSALEPVISGEIMSLHHGKHHATYTTNFKKALQSFDEASSRGDAAGCLAQLQALRFNGGGFVNHSMFWKNLCPVKETSPPEGALAERIVEQFGSLENLQNRMSAASAGVQGSGWGWLAFDPRLGPNGMLVVLTTANQDTLATIDPALVPLLGIDVWEHAYYIDYKNARPDYLKAIWKVVNWRDVGERLTAATSS